MLILVTDGVSDNFDPKLLGIDEVSSKMEWACQRMRELLARAFNPVQVVKVLLTLCMATTETSRDWHESGTAGKLPEDYRKYPGKMDHCTCLCVEFTE